MPISHILLALLVVIIWGVNFLFVKIGLAEISPLLLCALRFLLASVPAVLFIKPPSAPFKIVVTYGLVMFALQFSFVFLGMQVGMPAGMTSLLMQVQVFFSIFFAVIFLGEQPMGGQIIGALISFMGIGIVAMHFDEHVSLAGFLLILAASATWGVGNLITKKIKTTHLLSVVVWGSFAACLPMFIIALIFEGPSSFVTTYEHLTWRGFEALLYIVYVSTWVGYGVWNWLVSRYPVGMVVPFTLLIPVVGMISSVVVLGEPLQSWKVIAGLLVMGGLGVNLVSSRYFAMRLQPRVA